MAYSTSKFGDAGYVAAGQTTNVTAAYGQPSWQYGPRDTGGTAGVIKTEGAMNELTIDLDWEVLSEQAFVQTYAKPYLPALSRVTQVFLETEVAFTLGGTTPGVSVGTAGSEATNGVDITEAQLETVGFYDISSTLAGTWAAAGGLTAKTNLGVVLTGTTPTFTNRVGRARLIIRYVAA